MMLIPFMLASTACAKVPIIPQPEVTDNIIFERTNQLREFQNLKPLVMSHELNVKALDWSKRQHNGACGILRKICHKYSPENVAYISNTKITMSQAEEQFFKMWNNSRGHYRNMVGPYSKIGIGVYKGPKGYYATQIFKK